MRLIAVPARNGRRSNWRAVRARRRYRGALNELPRFAVGLFKGERRAGAAAILHRSPPIAGSGKTRLFLCLNEDKNEG
jgi:Protein of unknown function (DUF1826)